MINLRNYILEKGVTQDERMRINNGKLDLKKGAKHNVKYTEMEPSDKENYFKIVFFGRTWKDEDGPVYINVNDLKGYMTKTGILSTAYAIMKEYNPKMTSCEIDAWDNKNNAWTTFAYSSMNVKDRMFKPEYVNNDTIIFESRSFTLSQYERDSLAEIIGHLTGNLGDDKDIKQYSEYWEALTKEEQKQMLELYDLLDDDNVWPKVNSKLINKDTNLLLDFLNWADDNGLIDDNNYDLYDVIEKLEN